MGFIYAIRCGDYVKIGWSTDPIARLGKINTDNPLPCELVGTLVGTEADEKLAHASLSHWRVSGEWFDSTAETVREFCRTLRPPEVRVLRPIERIRRDVFDMKQAAFAAIAGATQGTVSRWETGECGPDLTHLHRIRNAAFARGLLWDDSLFFDASAPLPGRETA